MVIENVLLRSSVLSGRRILRFASLAWNQLEGIEAALKCGEIIPKDSKTEDCSMIKIIDGIAEYRWARRVGPPVDLNELGSLCRYRANHVANMLGISCRQLERDFRKYLGVTPKYWLREQRAQKAIFLISQGEDLGDVSKTLGFKRYGHFSREIRAFFGVRPVELIE